MNQIVPQHIQATIAKKIQLTKTVLLFEFTISSSEEFLFFAGQYAAFIIDEKTRRQYSFCSPPNKNSTFEIVIDTAPMGPGSKYFLSKNVDDTLLCMAPLGRFLLDKTTNRKKILVATGTGVAPFRSMIMDYLHTGGTDDVTMYWGMRREEDLYWVSEFQELSIKYPNFRFVVTLSQPSNNWKGSAGRVTAHVTQDESNLPSSDFYLCGNRMMIKDIENQLIKENVPLAQIHKEMYF